MTAGRTAAASVLLAVETGLAVLGVLVHYGFTAEYGDITDSAAEGFGSGFSSGLAGLALAVVVVAAGAAVWASSRRWMRAVALAIPLLMLLAMFAVTPRALDSKREEQFSSSPRCVIEEDGAGSSGPGVEAARRSQEAFDSIEMVGVFGGGGSSGVGGCDRRFVLTGDVDVLKHYRSVLPQSGWVVVDQDGQRLRAERGDMAFEVVLCGEGGVVWAGPQDASGGATCDEGETVGTP